MKSPPLQEIANKMNLIRQFKKYLIKGFLKFLRHEEVQEALNDTIAHSKKNLNVPENQPSPYFQGSNNAATTAERDDIVFITSRFRSGSTVLWNIFRNIEGCTAYYEPFNERRWFDKKARGEHVDSTHLGVDDYSKEYDELEQLAEFYNEDWIRSDLFMDANTWDPKMKLYICELIDKAKGRPILQFNRIDFRLPWLKHHFPNAKFIHLYRHPRDQWYSFLTDKNLMSKNKVEHTYQDAFYLDVWCNDLAKHFPFLDKRNTPHPYQRFYYLWKLSYLYGINECDHSIAFEELTYEPRKTLSLLFNELNIDDKHITSTLTTIKKPCLNKWEMYAENGWFKVMECECELNLTDFTHMRV